MRPIHELLTLTRPLVVFDTETTGTDAEKDRIIELGFQIFDATGLLREWRGLIDPQMPIPPGASAVHHITNADMKRCRTCSQFELEHTDSALCEGFKPVFTFEQLAVNLARGFSNCDFAGKNVRFDLRFMAKAMRRAGVNWTYDGACVIDAERLEQLAVPRSLSHLYKKYTGQELDGAHGALTDARASMVVIEHQLNQYETLPRDVKELHRLQWPGWIDTEGKFRFDDAGTPRVTFGKHRDDRMQDVQPGYWRFIIDKDFSEEIKDIARDALAGKFPVAPRAVTE